MNPHTSTPPHLHTQGKHIATVRLYVSTFKENMYVAVVRHLVFKHTKQPPLMQLSAGMTHHSAGGGGAGSAPQRRPDTAEREKLFWDR